MQLTKLFKEFFYNEKAGGIILILATITSLILANSPWQTPYLNIWNINIANHHLTHWINDGLMTLFFLMIGLELEREIYQGELSNLKNASLPIVGAVGGMIVPAGIYLIFNWATPFQSGAGIPMATDIAFAIGIISLLGNKVPASLKIFLTALAVIDDLGAVIVIALFYTTTLAYANLFIALAIWLILILLNRLKVCNLIPYILGGIAMWYFMLHSGVHATITGVLLAFAIPFNNGHHGSPSNKMLHLLHKPAAFVILPLFAMANTGIVFSHNWTIGFSQLSSIGIITGLIIGKPLGILIFTFAGSLLGLCALPRDLKWKNILGAGLLAGIGFTMSIFITLLAFNDESIINHSKMAILTASLTAGIMGFIFLKLTLKKVIPQEN